jgi:hypothetical protein
MKKLAKLIVLLLVSCGLAGCFQIDHVVTVSPDGSGTVEETFMISRQIAESMSAFAEGMGEQMGVEGKEKSAPKEQSFFKDDDIKKRAGGFGTDVTFVSMKRISNKQFEGYKALFSFRDINKLRLDQSDVGMPKQMGQERDKTPKGTEFVFTPGKTARLVIKQLKKDETAVKTVPETTLPDKETSAEELAMVRQVFDGLRMSTTIVIKGTVIESNATHRNGSIITLAEIDLGKLLDKPEVLAKMAELKPGDQVAAMEMFKQFPGMKIDMNDELRISFR